MMQQPQIKSQTHQLELEADMHTVVIYGQSFHCIFVLRLLWDILVYNLLFRHGSWWVSIA